MPYRHTVGYSIYLPCSKKTFFLFGPRATGKTHLINQQLANDSYVINLLRSEFFLRLSQSPGDLEARCTSGAKAKKIVVIDEVQKIPPLLDEVHRLIEENNIRFLLTGSSARKLKRGHANLLAGRAWTAALFPLCTAEIPNFNLEHFLRYGGLPTVYPSQDPEEELDAYVQTYLEEEILIEGMIRKLLPFSRFLNTAALSNGHQLNFTEIANDCQVPPSTIREYYSILEDTLMGFMLEPWTRSKRRKAVQTVKFYFFDTGVTHALAGTKSLDRNSDLYGKSFEHFIALELRAYLSYHRVKAPLNFWRTKHGHEVDFVIGGRGAIEVKSTCKVSPAHLKGLKALQEECVFKDYYLVSHDPVEAKSAYIHQINWKSFLNKLWGGYVRQPPAAISPSCKKNISHEPVRTV